MATRKAASTKKATAKKPAAAKASKTTVRTVSTSAPKKKAPAVNTEPVVTVAKREKTTTLPKNIINVIFAELVGTFILTLVALTSFNDGSIGAIAIGFALSIIVMTVGAVSGAHVNPAVTLGLWSVRKLKPILLPFYWGSQFLGAMLAVILTNTIAHNSINFSFDNFTSMDWSIFGIELVGTAVFLFALTAAVTREQLNVGLRALTIGLALTVGLLSSNYLLNKTKTQAVADYQKASQSANSNKDVEIPHSAYVKGASLNPAIALAMTDHTKAELTNSSASTGEVSKSRFTLESLLGALIGAMVGSNLYLLIANSKKND